MRASLLLLVSSKRQRVVNGNFANGATGWTLGSNWTLSGTNVITSGLLAGLPSDRAISQTSDLIAGNTYTVSFDVVANNFSGTTLIFRFQDYLDATKTVLTLTPSTPAGRYSARIVAANSSVSITTTAAAPAGSVTITNISVR